MISIENLNSAEPDRTTLWGSSLKNDSDEALFLELALRGYDLSKLRDSTNETAVSEIVKIG